MALDRPINFRDFHALAAARSILPESKDLPDKLWKSSRRNHGDLTLIKIDYLSQINYSSRINYFPDRPVSLASKVKKKKRRRANRHRRILQWAMLKRRLRRIDSAPSCLIFHFRQIARHRGSGVGPACARCLSKNRNIDLRGCKSGVGVDEASVANISRINLNAEWNSRDGIDPRKDGFSDLKIRKNINVMIICQKE